VIGKNKRLLFSLVLVLLVVASACNKKVPPPVSGSATSVVAIAPPLVTPTFTLPPEPTITATPCPLLTSTPLPNVTPTPGAVGEWVIYELKTYTLLVDPLFPQLNSPAWQKILQEVVGVPTNQQVRLMAKDFEASGFVVTSEHQYGARYAGDGEGYFGIVVQQYLLEGPIAWPTALDYLLARELYLLSENPSEPFDQAARFLLEQPLFLGIDYGVEGKRFGFRWGQERTFSKHPKLPRSDIGWDQPIVPCFEEARWLPTVTISRTQLSGYLIPGIWWGSPNQAADFFLFTQYQGRDVFVPLLWDELRGEGYLASIWQLSPPSGTIDLGDGYRLVWDTERFPQVNPQSWRNLLEEVGFSYHQIELYVEEASDSPVVLSSPERDSLRIGIQKYWVEDWPTALDMLVAEHLFKSAKTWHSHQSHQPSYAGAADFLSRNRLFSGIDYGKEGREWDFEWGKVYQLRVRKSGNWAFRTPVIEYPRNRGRQNPCWVEAGPLSGVLVPIAEFGSGAVRTDFALLTELKEPCCGYYQVLIPVSALER